MALKNLFDMVKADRYTADGREALIKAQEAETEDTRQPKGIYHWKSGDYRKEGDKYVKIGPGTGGAGPLNPAKKKAARVEQMQKASGKEAPYGRTLKGTPKTPDDDFRTERTKARAENKPAEAKTYKTSDIERVDKNNLKLGEVTATKEADGVWSVKNAKGEEVARALSVDIARESMVKSANRKPGESKYPNVSKEEKIKKLAEYFRSKYGKTTEEWSKTLEKSPEETLEDQYEEYAKKHPTDAAPRVLTGDTRIRVRKA